MLWTALTGANNYQKIYLIQWEFRNQKKQQIPDFNATTLMTAKTKSEQIKTYQHKYSKWFNPLRNKPITKKSKQFIVDHILAIIGHYKGSVNISKKGINKRIDYNLIKLFDPWHVDFHEDENYFNDNSEFWKIPEIKKQIPFTKDENDGKFFMSFENFVNKFDILFQMEVDDLKKPIAFQIPLSNLQDNTVNLEFDLSSTNETCLLGYLSWI